MGLVAAIQICSTPIVEDNLANIASKIKEVASKGAKMVALPENAVFLGQDPSDKLKIAEKPGIGPIQETLAKLAHQYGVWIIGGTLPILVEDKTHVYASTFVWDNKGIIKAQYDKMHLFDVTLSEKESYFESNTIKPGNAIRSFNSPVGKVGLSICYDIRFPELYRQLMQEGAEIFIVSSAFTRTTGQVHWESLLKARAIENSCYVIAPNQTGKHANQQVSFGHSMIIDPWGKILACLDEEEGFIMADIDLEYQKNLRKHFPVLNHRRIV